MILQSSISKLANRLYQEALTKVGRKLARRIPEDVIERDYVLAWFLNEMAAHTLLATALAFKGGTALRRVYFGEYRFSEDLDFTLTRSVSLDELFAAFRQVFDPLQAKSGITMRLDEDNVTNHTRNDTFFFIYKGPLPAEKTVKVDLTRDETIVFDLERKPVIISYPEYADLPHSAVLQVYALYEIAVEKVLALTDGARREPRDLYDLWFLLQEGYLQYPDEIVGGLSRKLASREGRDTDVLVPRLERVEAALRVAWNKRLSAQVEILPPFDDSFREVKRLMRTFDELRGYR